MSCGCGGGSPKPRVTKPANNANNVVSNLIQAGKDQPNKLAWFKEGAAGIAKCLGGKAVYTDQEIKDNRDKCRQCEHSTKINGRLTIRSQCMTPDPEKEGNPPCGCLIVCKTQTDEKGCPLKIWGKSVTLTISVDKTT